MWRRVEDAAQLLEIRLVPFLHSIAPRPHHATEHQRQLHGRSGVAAVTG
jgi:hypothetical protein